MLAIAKFLEMPSRNSHHGLGDTYVPYCDGIRPGRGHNQVQIEDRLKTETRATRAMRAHTEREPLEERGMRCMVCMMCVL